MEGRVQEAKCLLHLVVVVVAVEPFMLRGMNVALAVNENLLWFRCHLIQKIYLVYQTNKEFLVSINGKV